jgi:hypothetical protein
VSTATVAAASTTVGAAATAEAAASTTATTVAACSSTITTSYAAAGITASSATITTSYAAAGITASTAGIATSTARIAASSIGIATASVTVAAAAPAMTPAPVVPRSDADEDAAVKPVRTVITVRGASVGVIRVIAPFAIRGTVISGIADCGAYTYRDLGIRRDSGERKNNKHCQRGQCDQTELLHDILLVPPDS